MSGRKTLFEEIHSGLPREGPGDNASTRRAFSMLSALDDAPHILDVGCGPGMQTLALAGISPGTITALDNQQAFLGVLKNRAKKAGFEDRITPLCASMLTMPFEKESFDVIWSEGAVYIMGVREALQSWKLLLRRNGCFAFTQLCWLKREIPREAASFWAEAYPAMADIAHNTGIIEAEGYRLLGHFTLPESAWWNDYYSPLEKRLGILQEKYKGDAVALGVIKQSQYEIEIYRKYSGCYGYVFFVTQKDS